MKEQENGHLLLVALSTKESQMIDGGNVCGPMGPISRRVPYSQEGACFFWGFVFGFLGIKLNTLSIEESISIYGGNCKEAYNMGHKLGQKLRTIVDDILLATGIYKIL